MVHKHRAAGKRAIWYQTKSDYDLFRKSRTLRRNTDGVTTIDTNKRFGKISWERSRSRCRKGLDVNKAPAIYQEGKFESLDASPRHFFDIFNPSDVEANDVDDVSIRDAAYDRFVEFCNDPLFHDFHDEKPKVKKQAAVEADADILKEPAMQHISLDQLVAVGGTYATIGIMEATYVDDGRKQFLTFQDDYYGIDLCKLRQYIYEIVLPPDRHVDNLPYTCCEKDPERPKSTATLYIKIHSRLHVVDLKDDVSRSWTDLETQNDVNGPIDGVELDESYYHWPSLSNLLGKENLCTWKYALGQGKGRGKDWRCSLYIRSSKIRGHLPYRSQGARNTPNLWQLRNKNRYLLRTGMPTSMLRGELVNMPKPTLDFRLRRPKAASMEKDMWKLCRTYAKRGRIDASEWTLEILEDEAPSDEDGFDPKDFGVLSRTCMPDTSPRLNITPGPIASSTGLPYPMITYLVPYESFNDTIIGASFRLKCLVRSEAHCDIYVAEHLSDKQHLEARGYTLRGLTDKERRYRVRSLERAAARRTFLGSIEQNGRKWLILRGAPHIAMPQSQKHCASMWRSRKEYEAQFPTLAQSHRTIEPNDHGKSSDSFTAQGSAFVARRAIGFLQDSQESQTRWTLLSAEDERKTANDCTSKGKTLLRAEKDRRRRRLRRQMKRAEKALQHGGSPAPNSRT